MEKALASRLAICCCWVVGVVAAVPLVAPVVVVPVVVPVAVPVPLASALAWASRLLVEVKVLPIRSLIELPDVELEPVPNRVESPELSVLELVPSSVERAELSVLELVLVPSIRLISALASAEAEVSVEAPEAAVLSVLADVPPDNWL